MGTEVKAGERGPQGNYENFYRLISIMHLPVVSPALSGWGFVFPSKR